LSTLAHLFGHCKPIKIKLESLEKENLRRRLTARRDIVALLGGDGVQGKVAILVGTGLKQEERHYLLPMGRGHSHGQKSREFCPQLGDSRLSDGFWKLR